MPDGSIASSTAIQPNVSRRPRVQAQSLTPPTPEALAAMTPTELGRVIAIWNAESERRDLTESGAASDETANDVAYDAYVVLTDSEPKSISDAAAMLLSISHDMSDLLQCSEVVGAELPSYVALGRVIRFLCEACGFSVSDLGGDYFSHTVGGSVGDSLNVKYWCERALGSDGTLFLLEDGSVDFVGLDPAETGALRAEMSMLDAKRLGDQVKLIAGRSPALNKRISHDVLPSRRWAVTSCGACWNNTLVQLSGPALPKGVSA